MVYVGTRTGHRECNPLCPLDKEEEGGQKLKSSKVLEAAGIILCKCTTFERNVTLEPSEVN